MHELALMKSMVDILEKEIQDPKVGKIKTIHLEAGKLKYIVPEIIFSCFKELPKSEKLEKAEIKLDVLPVKLRCKTCGEETVLKGEEFICAECSSNDVEIISGNEFKIKGIEW